MNKLDAAIVEHRNEWIVYAKNSLLMEVEDIAEKVGLAVSTIEKYLRKFKDLLNKAFEIFDPFYVFKKKRKKIDDCIVFEADPLDEVAEKCYLFRFFDADNNLVCSKVGTTTRDVKQRAKEELRSKTYSNCTKIIVDRVYDCKNYPAEGLESRIRAEYIKKYPNSFKKNDRFIDTLFDLEEIDNIVRDYLK